MVEELADVSHPSQATSHHQQITPMTITASARGEWIQLFTASALCNEKAASTSQRQPRRGGDDVECRVRRAENLVTRWWRTSDLMRRIPLVGDVQAT